MTENLGSSEPKPNKALQRTLDSAAELGRYALGIMKFSIENAEVEIVDDFEGFNGWVGISSGDLYLGDVAFGYYVAAWYPNTDIDLKILVTAVGEDNSILLIGAICPVGQIKNLKPASHEELPWPCDGGAHSSYIPPADYKTYGKAKVAFKAAQFVVKNDISVREYIEGGNA